MLRPRELRERAQAVLAGKSRSYVEDARDFAPAVLEYASLVEAIDRGELVFRVPSEGHE